MRAVDIAFIIPLIVYFFMTFTGRFKAKANEAETELSKEE